LSLSYHIAKSDRHRTRDEKKSWLSDHLNTFSWFGRKRRLAKDYENLAAFVGLGSRTPNRHRLRMPLRRINLQQYGLR
jgi:hypothetical protein